MPSKIALETWPSYLLSENVPILIEKYQNKSIAGLNLKTLKIENVNTNINSIEAPFDWYEVKMRWRWKQILPKGYKILIVNNKQIKSINVEDISKLKGDVWIATPRFIEDIKNYQYEKNIGDILTYVCYFIGDGYRRRGNEIILSVEDIGLFHNVQRICRGVFNYDIPNAKHWENKIKNSGGKAFNISIGATDTYRKLDSYELPENKKNDIISIPDSFLKLPVDLLIKHVLTGLIETDGNIENVRIRYSTTSWKLAIQVFHIYLRARLQPNFEKIFQPLNGKIFTRYMVGLSGIRQLKKIRNMGFVFKHKRKELRLQNEVAKNLLLRRAESIIPSEIMQSELREIMKKFDINSKELAETSKIPLSTIKSYLAPNLKANISTDRAVEIIEALKAISNNNFMKLEKICYSNIQWCKLINIRKINNPGVEVIPKVLMKNIIPINNLIFAG